MGVYIYICVIAQRCKTLGDIPEILCRASFLCRAAFMPAAYEEAYFMGWLCKTAGGVWYKLLSSGGKKYGVESKLKQPGWSPSEWKRPRDGNNIFIDDLR